MGYQKKADLATETVIQLGGTNSKTGKANPSSVEGYYLGAKTTQSDFGEGKLHIFQTANGNVGVWGKTNSNRLLSSEHVGQMCKLVFTGMGKPQKGRKPPYSYELFFDQDNSISVATAAVEAFGEESAESNEYASEVSEDIIEDFAAEEEVLDEVPPARVAFPKKAAKPATSETRAKLQTLLNGRNKTS